MIKLSRHVTYEGPFFQHDPGQTFRQNLSRAVETVATEGLKITRDLTPVITGETRASLGAKTQRASLFASILPMHPNTGSAKYNPERTMFIRAAVVERKRHPFRWAATALRRAIKDIVSRELLKGIQ